MFAIAYFIFDVISPKRIERASQILQSTVDPTLAAQTRGSLEEFLRNYNKIEILLEKVGQPYEECASNSNIKRYPRRMPNSRLAEILLRNERIDKQLFTGLRELITLRNSIIHGAEPMVSQAMVDASVYVLKELQRALGEDQTSGGQI